MGSEREWAGGNVSADMAKAEWDDSSNSRTRNLGASRRVDAEHGKNKINIETRRSTTPGKRVILVQGPC